MVRQPLFLEGDVRIGNDFDTGYCVVLRDCTIGDNVRIWSHCTVDPGAIIGNDCRFHNHCYICQGAVIEDNVFFGPGVILANDKYPPRFDPELWDPPIIRKGAILGAGVIVCPGVIIGVGAMIGAGSVVTKNVPDGEVWVGNPARKLK